MTLAGKGSQVIGFLDVVRNIWPPRHVFCNKHSEFTKTVFCIEAGFIDCMKGGGGANASAEP